MQHNAATWSASMKANSSQVTLRCAQCGTGPSGLAAPSEAMASLPRGSAGRAARSAHSATPQPYKLPYPAGPRCARNARVRSVPAGPPIIRTARRRRAPVRPVTDARSPSLPRCLRGQIVRVSESERRCVCVDGRAGGRACGRVWVGGGRTTQTSSSSARTSPAAARWPPAPPSRGKGSMGRDRHPTHRPHFPHTRLPPSLHPSIHPVSLSIQPLQTHLRSSRPPFLSHPSVPLSSLPSSPIPFQRCSQSPHPAPRLLPSSL